MLHIPCPWCGPRAEIEFRYGGSAEVAYPTDPASVSDREWADYVYFRDNPNGWFAERWVHTYGCRRWCTVVRHTLTNDIAASYQPAAAHTRLPSDADHS